MIANLVDAVGCRVRNIAPAGIKQRNNEKTVSNITKFMNEDISTIQKRIRLLEREWDVERIVKLQAAVTVLGSTYLGFKICKKWFVLAGIEGLFMLQQALLRESLPSMAFRILGVRTEEEIEEERNILHALLGRKR